MKVMVTQVDPLKLMEVHSGRDSHSAVCGSLHDRAALKEAAAHGKPMLEQDSERTCGPWRDTSMQKQILCKDLQPSGVPT